MNAVTKRRLQALEGRAGAINKDADKAGEMEAWRRLLRALREGLGNSPSYEADVLSLDNRLVAGEANQADHEALSYLPAADLTRAGVTAADVVALEADIYRSY